MMVLLSCDSVDGRDGDSTDSVSTDSLKDPSYNPSVEADSAARQMNLDSTTLKDSAGPSNYP